MLCRSRDDVLEEGLNVWAGEENPSFKPKYDIILLHGLGSHPYWAWLQQHGAPSRPSRASSLPVFCDSTGSFFPSSSPAPRSPAANDGSTALLSSPDFAFCNEYSDTDILGRIGTFWPRDLLALDIPDARICTLGYRSQWTSARFQTSFRECGEHMLTVLERSRRSEDSCSRPIIFIAHSFGGLVVQSALVSAQIDERFSQISRSVAGCLFLGCPFNGTDAVSLLSMAASFSGNNQQILSSLRPGNRDLLTLQDQFLRLYRDLPMVCFFETVKSGFGRTMMVVTEQAARIAGVKGVALHKDHGSLNKFSSSTDESYLAVLAELKTMTETAKHVSGSRLRKNGWLYRDERRHGKNLRQVVKSTMIGAMTGTPQGGAHLWHAVGVDDGCSQTLTVGSRHARSGRDAKQLSDRPKQDSNTKRRFQQGKRGFYSEKSGGLNAPGNMDEQHVEIRPTGTHRSDVPLYLPLHLQESYRALGTPISSAKPTPIGKPFNTSMQFQTLGNNSAVELPAGSLETAGHSVSRKRILAMMRDNTNVRDLRFHPTPLQPEGFPEVERASPSNHLRAWSNSSDYLGYGGDHVKPPSYVRRIEQDLIEDLVSVAEESRSHIFDQVKPRGSTLVPNGRLALTGPLGVGKSFLAVACVQRLLRDCPTVPVFWLTAESSADFVADCDRITELVGLEPSETDVVPWIQCCNILHHLRSTLVGPWVVVIDGANGDEVGNTEFHKLCETELGTHGNVMVTTRDLNIAEAFLNRRGVRLDVGILDPCYAANTIGLDTSMLGPPSFDTIAHLLSSEPSTTTRVRAFLSMTRMRVTEFAAQLAIVLDESNWASGGPATMAAKAIGRKQQASVDFTTTYMSATAPVLRSCLNPTWALLFDRLYQVWPAACELLSVLSAVGSCRIPSFLLSSNAAVSTATKILVDQCYLRPRTDDLQANRLMLMAHRVWLIETCGLGLAFQAALRMVACEYPDAIRTSLWTHCEALEPFAEAVTSDVCSSWIDMDDTARYYRTMLFHKRSKYYRLSKRNPWEVTNMEEAEAVELRALFAVRKHE